MNRWIHPTPEPTGRGAVARSTASEEIAHLHAYEQACEHGEGGAYLRREGLYSSFISEWRKQRDAGVLAGKRPGEKGRQAHRRTGRDRAAHRRAGSRKQAVAHHRGRPGHHGPSTRSLGVTVRESGLRRAAQEALTETFGLNADRTWCIDKAGSHIDRAGPLDRDSAAQRRHGAHARSLHRACGRAGQQTHRCRTAPGR